MPEKKHLAELELLYLLSGGMVKDKATQEWRTSRFDEMGDTFGAIGDYVRVHAAKAVYALNPKVTIYTTSGKGQFKDVPGAPTLSALYKKELVALGVPAESIIEESQTGNTYEQLAYLAGLVGQKKYTKVAIVSNRWHVPRIHAMIEARPELKKALTGNHIIYLSAEAVVMQLDESEPWEVLIHDAYQSPQLKERIQLEARGVEDIKNGRYTFSDTTARPPRQAKK